MLILILLKLTLREDIAHLATLDLSFQLDPDVGERAPWRRSNWITLEFGLLYR